MGILHKLFSYEYISKEHLTGLDRYKYNCVDTSPISIYLMQPFWNAIVNIYPKWLAPNVITFIGFNFLILQSFLFSIYDYSFYGYCFDRDNCLETNAVNLSINQQNFQDNLAAFDTVPSNVCSCIPRWLFCLIAVCQFLSHHLDGTDGKQARRTGSSSPLGELFDHGLDSWATLFLPVALFSIYGRNGDFGLSVHSMYGILWLILLSFIVSHWEKYNTGIMFLPWSYDLSQLGMTFLFFLTFLFGQEVWFFRISFLGNMPSTKVIEVIIYVFALGLSVPFSVYNMYQAYLGKTFKQESVYEAVRPLFSTVCLFVLQLIWIEYSPSQIMELEPRAFFWLTGTLFSNIACRLIIAQMTSTRCRVFNIGIIPLTFCVALVTLSPFNAHLSAFMTRQNEVYILYFMVVLVTIQHIHYGICMVRQICSHLNIYCFVITSKPSQNRKVQ